MKKLMILGAGEMQVPTIRKAKELEIYTIVADMNPSAVGMQYADKALMVSTMDIKALRKYAIELAIDGILTTSDAPVKIVAAISGELGLPAMPPKVASICTNKYLQRKLFRENEIPTPFFCLCNEAVDLDSFHDFPYIIKPIDSSASRGVRRVNNLKELKDAFDTAIAYSLSRQVIIESYISGREFSVETFTQNNKTTIVTITEKLIIGEDLGYFVENTHIEPARITVQEWDLISKTVLEAISLIGFDNCPSHAEVKMNGSGIYIIEIACRLGGDYITSDLVPLSTGIDMLGNLVNCSIGLPIDVCHRYKKCSAVQFLNQENYQRCVEFLNKDLSSVVYRCEVKPYSDKTIKSSLDRLGYIIFQTNTMEELEYILKEIN